jgi:hypothetical protein
MTVGRNQILNNIFDLLTVALPFGFRLNAKNPTISDQQNVA